MTFNSKIKEQNAKLSPGSIRQFKVQNRYGSYIFEF